MKQVAPAFMLGTLLLCQLSAVLGDEPRQPWTTSRVTGAPYPPAPYKIVPAFPGVRFTNPTCIEEIPGANRLLITEIGGRILSVAKDPNVQQADLVADLAELSRPRREALRR